MTFRGLRGLQHLYTDRALREKVIQLLEEKIAPPVLQSDQLRLFAQRVRMPIATLKVMNATMEYDFAHR